MAITTRDQALAGMLQPNEFAKAATPTLVAGRPHSLWYLGGIPGAGSAPAPGIGGAQVTATTTGQLPFTNPVSGNTYLARLQAQATQPGTLLLCDRLWHNSGISATVTTAQTFTSAPQIPARDLDGVVGEALVEAAQQRHVDRRGHAVLPLAVHHHAEQMTVQVIHRVVFFLDAGRALGVLGEQYLLRGVAQFDCQAAHFGKVAVDLLGQRVLRVPAAGDLGDVQRQRAHAVDIGDDLDGADHGPQVAGDRRLQGQQDERLFFGLRAHDGDLLVVGNDLLGQYQVGLQQGLGRALHGNTGQSAHLAEAVGEGFKLLVVRGTHGLQTTFWPLDMP